MGVDGGWRSIELDVEAGGGGGFKGGWCGAYGEQKLGCSERAERGGEREALLEEETGWDETGTVVAQSRIEQVVDGRLQDECRRVRVHGGELGGESCAHADSIGDNTGLGEVAADVEVLPGGFGVLGQDLLAGVWGGSALAVATVVDGEDVDAEVVQGNEGGGGVRVGEGTIAGREIEQGEVGIAGAGEGWNPPAGELGDGGVVGGEAEELGGGDWRLGGSGTGGVQDNLPLAEIEEQTEAEVSAEDRDEDDQDESLGDPARVDHLRRGLLWTGARGDWDGAGHQELSIFS